MIKLGIKNYNMVLTEKQQKYQHHLHKFDKHENLTGEEILLSDQSRIIQQARFANSPLGKSFEIKTIVGQ